RPTDMLRNALLVVVIASSAACSAASQPPSPSAGESRLFAMQSNLWVNLHHFLYATARARRGMDSDRVAVSSSLSDTAGLGALTNAPQAAWNTAVDFYMREVAPKDLLFDSTAVEMTIALSKTPSNSEPRSASITPGLAAALTQAAPVYRSLWWPRHDASN